MRIFIGENEPFGEKILWIHHKVLNTITSPLVLQVNYSGTWSTISTGGDSSEEIKSLTTKLNQLGATVSEINLVVTSLKTGVSSNNTSIGNLNTEVSLLDSKISTNATNIAANTTRLTALEEKVASISGGGGSVSIASTAQITTAFNSVFTS